MTKLQKGLKNYSDNTYAKNVMKKLRIRNLGFRVNEICEIKLKEKLIPLKGIISGVLPVCRAALFSVIP